MAKKQKLNLCVSRVPPSLFAHTALLFQTMHCEEIFFPQIEKGVSSAGVLLGYGSYIFILP
jgi:hypothetical protein